MCAEQKWPEKVVANLLMMAVVCSGCSDNAIAEVTSIEDVDNKYRGNYLLL